MAETGHVCRSRSGGTLRLVSGFDTLRRLCQDATAERVTPGLVVVVGAGGETVFHEAFGLRQVEPAPLPATPDTVYDLASLTKALVTSLLAAQAVAEGRLRLDDPLVPDGRAPGATVGLALAHAAGRVAHRRFHDRVVDELGGATWSIPSAATRARVVEMAAEEPAAYPPGTRSLYSDLGFISLGDRLERTFGARLDRLADERLFRPLGLEATGFVSLLEPDGGRALLGGRPVAAGPRCPVRGRLVVGEVDDLNAWAMGGIAGHAGLFGTGGDVARMAHALIAVWRGAPGAATEIVPTGTLRSFWSPAGIPGSTWRRGWDGPAPANSLAGARLSRDAVGHLAFTGCSLWIDPARETFVAVLTNRVHPVVADDSGFRALRPALNDAALEALGYAAA
jgi:serine-type D-Ala-D-Ala carboxypeptidase